MALRINNETTDHVIASRERALDLFHRLFPFSGRMMERARLRYRYFLLTASRFLLPSAIPWAVYVFGRIEILLPTRAVRAGLP